VPGHELRPGPQGDHKSDHKPEERNALHPSADSDALRFGYEGGNRNPGTNAFSENENPVARDLLEHAQQLLGHVQQYRGAINVGERPSGPSEEERLTSPSPSDLHGSHDFSEWYEPSLSPQGQDLARLMTFFRDTGIDYSTIRSSLNEASPDRQDLGIKISIDSSLLQEADNYQIPTRTSFNLSRDDVRLLRAMYRSADDLPATSLHKRLGSWKFGDRSVIDENPEEGAV